MTASAIVQASRLLGEGAVVVAYDPVATENTRTVRPSIEYAGSPREALAGSDAGVLVTQLPEFVHLDWAAARDLMRRPTGRPSLSPDLRLQHSTCTM
ncbi:MAG: hypothetical protein Kow00122_18770 [Thermoleophilia bacterium]